MDKISVKQAYILFMLAVFAPLIRLTASLGASLGGRAGWVSIFISCAVFYGLNILFGNCFEKQGNADLYTLYKSAFGKITAKIFILLYMIWLFFLAGFYLRAFTDKFEGLIMPGVPGGFYTITLFALVFIILGGGLQSFAILSGIFFYIALFALLIIFTLQIPQIRPENLLPVTALDFPSVIRGTLPTLGIFAYITPLLFLGEDIKTCNYIKNDFKKYGLYGTFALLGVNLVIFAVTTGVFGKDLTASAEQPFLMSVKTIGAEGALERLESIFVLLWVVTELAVIVMLMKILLKLTGFLTLTEKPEIFKSPLLLGVYVISLFLSRYFPSTRDLNELSEQIILPFNLLAGFAIPVAAIIVYNLRKSFSKNLSTEDNPPTARTLSRYD